MRAKVAVLVSGGIDSTVAYNLARKQFGEDNVVAVFVDYGQPYREKELKAVSSFIAEPLVLVNADLCTEVLKNVPTVYKQEVYGRNLLLAFYGALVGEIVWLAALENEMTPREGTYDKGWQFFHSASSLLTLILQSLGPNTAVFTPFSESTKSDVVGLGLDLGISIGTLKATVSCYSPGPKPCGACLACVKRWIAFTNNDIEEEMESNPLDSRYLHSIILEMQDEFFTGRASGRFTVKRKVETHNALVRSGSILRVFHNKDIMES